MSGTASPIVRVVYVRHDGLAASLPLETLGSDGDYVWAAMPAPAVLAAVQRGWPLLLLWFWRADYDRAVRALPPAEVLRAVRYRLDTFSNRAAGSTLAPVMAAAEGLLAAERSAGQSTDRGFARLAALVGDGAWQDLPLPEVWDRCLDDVTRLAVELALPEAEPDAEQEMEHAHALARAGAARWPGTSASLPAIAPRRAWVTQRNPQLERRLWVARRPHAFLGDEVLFDWVTDSIAEVAAGARMVHADPGVLEERMAQTPAQRERDLGELVAAAPASLPEATRILRAELRRDAAIRLGWLAAHLHDEALIGLAAHHRDAWLSRLSPGPPLSQAASALREELQLAVALSTAARFEGAALRNAAALADLDAQYPPDPPEPTEPPKPTERGS